jgi:hypothetical protein
MKGDFTRFTFDPHKHYSRVLMQQGRVQLDADWNEMVETQLHFLRALAVDLIGPHGGSGDSFKISLSLQTGALKDLIVGVGHYYVNGILCENEERFGADGNLLAVSYYSQPHLRLDPAKDKLPNLPLLVYLDVWERHVTYVEDEDENTIGIREVALRRPDTTTRTQIVWQVKCIPITITAPDPPPDFKSDDGYKAFLKLLPDSRDPVTGLGSGQLRARAIKPSSGEDAPCLTSPEARYRGAENQLYRVEIHQSGPAWNGDKDTKDKAATFKWSRENGAVIFPIEEPAGSIVTLGHDDRFGLHRDDWVEIVDDDYVLQNRAEPLLQIKDIDPDTLQVTLKKSPSSTVGQDLTKHPLLRRWDQHTNDLQDGAVLIVEKSGDEDSAWIQLEDGVQIQFPLSPPGSGPHIYRTGDYWLIPARVATGDVEWPGKPGEPQSLPPHGVRHHYAPLALISLDANGDVTVKPADDYRRTIKQISS